MSDSPFGVYGGEYYEYCEYDGYYEEVPNDRPYNNGASEAQSREEVKRAEPPIDAPDDSFEALKEKIYDVEDRVELLEYWESQLADDDPEDVPSENTIPMRIYPAEPEDSGPADHPQEITPWKGNGSKKAERLGFYTQEISESNNLLTSAGLVFAYNEDAGYFRRVSAVRAYLANILPPDVVNGLMSRDLDEIAERLSWNKDCVCSIDSFNRCPSKVNLENGVWDLETGQILPHDLSYRFTYRVKASYLEDSKEISCPEFDRFCKTSLEGDPSKRQLLLEFIGYICLDSNGGKCALFLKGQPNSGKSMITNFICRLFDEDIVSSVPIHQLNDQFYRAELAGKKLNAVGEMAGKALNDISTYKSITGGDRILGEFKGENPFYFTPRCKLLFSGNTLPLPKDLDATAAFVNRIKVLLFNKSVELKDWDKLLPEKLWDERDSIVTLALQAAQGLVQSGYQFTLPEDSQKFLDGFTLRGNILEGFLQECCILRPEARVFNTVLYGAFVAYCERHGLDCLSRQEFYHRLSGVPNVFYKKVRIGTETRWGHIGIALKA